MTIKLLRNLKKENKMSKQIKCYNINYLVEEEDLLANQSFNSIDDLHNSLPKEVIFGKESVEEFEEKLADNISDETGWLVKSFDWKVEESPTIFYDKENSLDRFMKGKKS
jgi:uncharacterized LabA/DUF88 family protein